MEVKNWQEEYKEWKDLKPFQVKLLEEGAQSQSQAWLINSMWCDWKALSELKETGNKEKQADSINKDAHKRKGPNRLVPRQLKQFATPTVVSIKNDKQNIESILRIIAADRPGLLALVGGLFIDLEVLVHQARITTLGENVEDIFHITDRNNQPIIKPEDISRITQTLGDKIDNEIKESVA